MQLLYFAISYTVYRAILIINLAISELGRRRIVGGDGHLRATTNNKFNGLSVAITLPVLALIIFYLPSVTHRSINWAFEGHLLGLSITVIGIIVLTFVVSDLTQWTEIPSIGVLLLLGGLCYGLILVLHDLKLFHWVAITLILLIVFVLFFVIFLVIAIAASFFDTGTRGPKPVEPMSRYERITLLVAIVSAAATVIASFAAFF
jgi:hypothetical protein